MIQKFKKQLIECGQSLFERGYAYGSAGNISLKADEGIYLATPTGSCLGRLREEEVSVLDASGTLIEGNRPSKEVAFHFALYKEQPAFNAVVHLHSTYLTALSCVSGLDPNSVIRPCTPYGVMSVGDLKLIEYLPPGSPRIAEELAKYASSHSAFLLANHGPVVAAPSLELAMNNSEELEEAAKLFFLLRDHDVRYLSPAEIEELKTRSLNSKKALNR